MLPGPEGWPGTSNRHVSTGRALCGLGIASTGHEQCEKIRSRVGGRALGKTTRQFCSHTAHGLRGLRFNAAAQPTGRAVPGDSGNPPPSASDRTLRTPPQSTRATASLATHLTPPAAQTCRSDERFRFRWRFVARGALVRWGASVGARRRCSASQSLRRRAALTDIRRLSTAHCIAPYARAVPHAA
eukprot:1009998-Rhodomonas_salina.6